MTGNLPGTGQGQNHPQQAQPQTEQKSAMHQQAWQDLEEVSHIRPAQDIIGAVNQGGDHADDNQIEPYPAMPESNGKDGNHEKQVGQDIKEVGRGIHQPRGLAPPDHVTKVKLTIRMY